MSKPVVWFVCMFYDLHQEVASKRLGNKGYKASITVWWESNILFEGCHMSILRGLGKTLHFQSKCYVTSLIHLCAVTSRQLLSWCKNISCSIKGKRREINTVVKFEPFSFVSGMSKERSTALHKHEVQQAVNITWIYHIISFYQKRKKAGKVWSVLNHLKKNMS